LVKPVKHGHVPHCTALGPRARQSRDCRARLLTFSSPGFSPFSTPPFRHPFSRTLRTGCSRFGRSIP
jgi:hypothetical protein